MSARWPWRAELELLVIHFLKGSNRRERSCRRRRRRLHYCISILISHEAKESFLAVEFHGISDGEEVMGWDLE